MKILLSGGGTAGHTTPLLAVADTLRKLVGDDQLDITYIGQRGDISAQTMASNTQLSVKFIHAGKFRRYHTLGFIEQVFNMKPNLLNIRDAFFVVMGFFESLYLLLADRPDVIFFKGGYVVVPLGTAARILRIPYITHDSDSVPGLANRLIAKGATFNAVAHPGVTYYPKGKTVVTGIPISQEFVTRRGEPQLSYKQKLGIPADSLHLFIYTGSQGSTVIDNALDIVLPKLLAEYPHLYVTHVFGRLNEHTLNDRYSTISPDQAARVRKVTFIDNAYDYIASADIIVGRAGATSIAEFAAVGRACIIVPAEQLTGGHQIKNAELLAASGSIELVRESTLESDLEKSISKLASDSKYRHSLEHALRSFYVENASEHIAKLILKVVTK